MDEAREIVLDEAIAQLRVRARRYVQEPAEGAWNDLLRALMGTFGASETYDLLRAFEIHSRAGIER